MTEFSRPSASKSTGAPRTPSQPYRHGKGWAIRRSYKGHALFLSGFSTAAAASKAMRQQQQDIDDQQKPAGTVSRTLGIEFRDKLQAWAIEKGKTATTADNILVSLRALFNVARDKGWLSSNPLERLSIKKGGKESEGREPWTREELSLIFNDPLWTKRAIPTDKKAGKEAAYWIPLIACYTGARLTEIAQLWTDDIVGPAKFTATSNPAIHSGFCAPAWP